MGLVVGRRMERRSRRMGALLVLGVILAGLAAPGVIALGQTWPYCLTGCSAGDVFVPDAPNDVRLVDDLAGGRDLQVNVEHKGGGTKYCVVINARIREGTAAPYVVTIQLYSVSGGPNWTFIKKFTPWPPAQTVVIEEIYIMWQPNAPGGGICSGICADYDAGSKCNSQGPYVVYCVPPTADFSASTTTPCVGGTVTFTDQSTGSPTSWSWSFPGGTPNTATGVGPHTITYNTAGPYNVALTVTNACGSDTETKTSYITVSECPPGTGTIRVEKFVVGPAACTSWPFTITGPESYSKAFNLGNGGFWTDGAGPVPLGIYTITETNTCGCSVSWTVAYTGGNTGGTGLSSLRPLGRPDGGPGPVAAIQLAFDGETATVVFINEECPMVEPPTPGSFPPRIDETASRNQAWDVSIALAKVYTTRVFTGQAEAPTGTTGLVASVPANMRFLDGQYREVTQIPISGSLYLEVTDQDQNEHPMMRELVFGGWNRDASAGDDDTPANEDSMPLWGRGRAGVIDGVMGLFLPGLRNTSISGIPETVKVLIFNPQRGTWERMDLRETAVGSGVFRSTTCVPVTGQAAPVFEDASAGALLGPAATYIPMGHLESRPGDTIMAFYQDPSDHSDMALISIKVSEGGMGGVMPGAPSLAFDRGLYNQGDTGTLTVTDPLFAFVTELAAPSPLLVLKGSDGAEIESWNTLPGVTDQAGRFRVTFTLPATVPAGTLTATYTDPTMPGRTATATASVAGLPLQNVTSVIPVPEVFSTQTAFTAITEPSGAVAERIVVRVYDLTGRRVASLEGTQTATVGWTGGTLRNGAYLYVAEVRGPAGQLWSFKGFVYIKR